MHPGPLDRLAGAPAFPYRLQVRAIGPDLRMTIHAGLGRRYAGKGELLDGCVTVSAVNTIIANVMLVAKLNRLLAREESLSVVRGPVEFEQQPDDESNEEERAED